MKPHISRTLSSLDNFIGNTNSKESLQVIQWIPKNMYKHEQARQKLMKRKLVDQTLHSLWKSFLHILRIVTNVWFLSLIKIASRLERVSTAFIQDHAFSFLIHSRYLRWTNLGVLWIRHLWETKLISISMLFVSFCLWVWT